MAKPRTCPNCQTPIPIGQGYRFDDQGNMICDSCGKIVYPAGTKATTQPMPTVPQQTYGPWQQPEEDPEPDPDVYQQ